MTILVRISILVAFLTGLPQAWSQNSNALRKSEKDASGPLYEIEMTVDEDPSKALDLLDRFLRSNGRKLDQDLQKQVYILAGQINFNLEQYELAVSNYKKAIEEQSSKLSRYKSIGKSFVLPTSIWFQYGQALYANNQLIEAINATGTFLQNVSSTEPEIKIPGLLLMANILIGMGEVDQSFPHLEEARVLSEKLKDPKWQLEVDYVYGVATEKSVQLESSLSNYQSALQLSDSLNLDSRSEDITESIGRVYQAQNDRQGELSFKKSRRAKSIEDNNRLQQNTLDLDIASIYLDLNQAEEAIPFLQESVDISEEEGNLETNIAARKSLSDVYATTGDYNLALANYRSYVELVDQLYKNKEREIALSAEVQKDLFERQQTINSLEKDRQLYESEIAILENERELREQSMTLQRNSIYGLSALFMVVLGSSILLYRSNQKKKVSNRLLALKSLRSQMNPHFIFNALNSVNSFISANDTREANKYLTDFSRLMRIVMENSQKEFVPFDEEMEVLALYLKLEHYRFQDQFQYQLEIGEELKSQELRIPPMLAQPYIENAIWHGLRYKELEGHLQVIIGLEGDHVMLIVRDDGIGRKRSQELKTANQLKNGSTGMKNTKDRIELLNKTYRSQIEVEIGDLEPGTEVNIRIPLSLLQGTI